MPHAPCPMTAMLSPLLGWLAPVPPCEMSTFFYQHIPHGRHLSTTVTCELRVQPGHVAEIIQRATEQLSVPSHSVVGRRHARLYQHFDDPHRLLYVGEWESRNAFETYRANAPLPGRPDQFVELPTIRYYRRLALFEHVLTPFDLVYVDHVEGAPGTHASRRDLALGYHRQAARGHRGLALLMTTERLDGPQDLLIVSGWRQHPSASPVERAPDQTLFEQLRGSGGMVNRFIGRPLLETPGLSALN